MRSRSAATRWNDKATLSAVGLPGMRSSPVATRCAKRSPCRRRKAGLALIKRTPIDRDGLAQPLYVNLTARSFPKRSQPARRPGYKAARVLSGGSLRVVLLRGG